MVELSFDTREIAYLLGAVGAMLQRRQLEPRDREALLGLRDRLAPLLPLETDIEIALGLASRGRLQ